SPGKSRSCSLLPSSNQMSDCPRILSPGDDGELPWGANLWRKGLVYTTRARPSGHPSVSQGYRISAGFKRTSEATGFHETYRRTSAIASYGVSQLTCAATGIPPRTVTLCHAWGSLGDKIGVSLILLELRCADDTEGSGAIPIAPSESDLQS